MEQILTDRNISESDPLANVANNSSTLIFQTLQYMKICTACTLMHSYYSFGFSTEQTSPHHYK